MAGITIHIDERHITETLRRPIPADQMEVIQRQLEQFIREQDFQQAVDREILRLYQAETQPTVSEQAVIWTDGSCLSNPGRGGWAYVLTTPNHGTLEERSGHDPDTTNNRMELAAIAEALEAHAGRFRHLTVWTDSQYAVNAFNQGWIRKWETNDWRTAKRQPVKNQDLWQRIRQALADGTAEVRFVWVKGHAGHPDNERADRLAHSAAQRG